MILLNREQIKYLHNKMIRETGGSNGICDEGLLDSALSAPFNLGKKYRPVFAGLNTLIVEHSGSPQNRIFRSSRGFLRGGIPPQGEDKYLFYLWYSWL
ncbi:MAG: hypothetical protein K2P50_04990, partial [Lachnospiraceae bacterium]|nr:hypothetical protein [Lachnospiraceae bacterium]